MNGFSHHNAKDRTDVTPGAVPMMPKLGGWHDLDSAIAWRFQHMLGSVSQHCWPNAQAKAVLP